MTAICNYNYNNYLTSWGPLGSGDNASSLSRPPIWAILKKSTTVTTTLLESSVVKTESEDSPRIVNNITIAIPHGGIPSAARNPRNNLIQPENLQGTGYYSVVARLANPVLNALCVNANQTELAPIVYEAWPNVNGRLNTSIDALGTGYANALNSATEINNKTLLDNLFGWRDQEPGAEVPADEIRPVFFKYPTPGNTIANHTSWNRGRSAVYILGKRPQLNDTGDTEDYFLCSLRSSITTMCSTRYNASASGQTLEALCGPEHRYDGPVPFSGDFIPAPNWMVVGTQFLNTMSLNTGVMDWNTSSARMIGQFQLAGPVLNPEMPSFAEALLSMSSCTVLDLIQEFSVVPFLSYTDFGAVKEPKIQYFNSSVRVVQYMSGSNVRYLKAFIVILAMTFAINLLVHVYHGIIVGICIIIDICKPLSLFVLGYGSSPYGLFQESFQDGLHNRDYTQSWAVEPQPTGEMVVVGKKETEPVDLATPNAPSLRARFARLSHRN